MTLTGCHFCDARFEAGLELGNLAARAGMNRDRMAYAEAMYGASAWSGAEFGRVRAALDALVLLKGRCSAMRRS